MPDSAGYDNYRHLCNGVEMGKLYIRDRATDVQAMVEWAVQNAMDYVVVAPDDPLARCV